MLSHLVLFIEKKLFLSFNGIGGTKQCLTECDIVLKYLTLSPMSVFLHDIVHSKSNCLAKQPSVQDSQNICHSNLTLYALVR